MGDEKEQKKVDQKQEKGGSLIRGADGALYFIPDEKLSSFKLPEEEAYLAEKLLFHPDNFQFASSIRGRLVEDSLGLRASGSTTVSIMNLSSIRQLKR